MALLDKVLGDAGAWMWINSKLKPSCKQCAKGLRVDSIAGKVLTRFTHSVDGKTVRCTAPWSWRQRVAAGKWWCHNCSLASIKDREHVDCARMKGAVCQCPCEGMAVLNEPLYRGV
jgi:hypothetical protein